MGLESLFMSDEDEPCESYNDEASKTTCRLKLSSPFNIFENTLMQVHSSFNQITSLDVSNSNLSFLPQNLETPCLKNLNLSNNKFIEVPSCLYNRTLLNLEILDMSYNQVKNFDIEPNCILTLKVLKLNNNSFCAVPNWLLTFRCTNLEEFNYSDNRAIHYNYSKYSLNLTFMKLSKLELRNSCLVDRDIKWLKCFRNLIFLDISNYINNNSKFTNKFNIVNELFAKPKWKSITILKLNFLNLFFIPEGITSMTSLKELYIANNSLSWFPKGMENLINLEILDVSNNQLILIPNEISELLKLQVLNASNNNLESVPYLSQNLEVLDLYNNCLIEIINLKLKHIIYLDLDCNCINLKNCHAFNYLEYVTKRDAFRNLYRVENRCDNIKIRQEYLNEEPERYSESSNDELTENENYCTTFNQCFEEEDWDIETTKNCNSTHPNITLSDHEYDGKSLNSSLQNLYHDRNYFNEEDWIFVDAD